MARNIPGEAEEPIEKYPFQPHVFEIVSTIMATTAAAQSTLSFPRETFAKLSPHPYLLAHLQPQTPSSSSTRANGRLPTEFRPPHVNNGSLTHVEGSAVVRVGDTTVVCGVRGEILLASDATGFRVDRPSTIHSNTNEAKELDLLIPNIELATGCSPLFLPGQPPSALAQSLSTRLYSLLHSSNLVDTDDLKIWYHPPVFPDESNVEEAAVAPEIKAFWTLYIDILVISLDGNPFDAAWAAIISALKDVRLPHAYWDIDREAIICSDLLSESNKLHLRGFPIASTYTIFRTKEQTYALGGKDGINWLLADPDTFEESLCDETITITVDCSETKSGKLLGLSKSGGTIVDRTKMGEVLKLSVERWEEWKKAIESKP
jgi:exosome complex component RRP43